MALAFDCVRLNFPRLNGVIVTHNVQDFFSPENLKVFEILKSELKPELVSKCMLLLTHAENKSEAARVQYKAQLLETPAFGSIKDLFEGRIYFSSGLDTDLIATYPTMEEPMVKMIKKDCCHILRILTGMAEKVSPLENIEYFERAEREAELKFRATITEEAHNLFIQKLKAEKEMAIPDGKLVYKKDGCSVM